MTMTRSEYIENLHPGTTLREDYLPDLGWTPYRLAKELGITQSNLAEILSGKRGITANLAFLLGKLFNQSAELWIGLQAQYDIEVAKDKYAADIEKATPVPAGDLSKAA